MGAVGVDGPDARARAVGALALRQAHEGNALWPPDGIGAAPVVRQASAAAAGQLDAVQIAGDAAAAAAAGERVDEVVAVRIEVEADVCPEYPVPLSRASVEQDEAALGVGEEPAAVGRPGL